MTKVYISHSSKDSELADRFTKNLSAAGFSVFSSSTNLMPGQDWRTVLSETLKASDIIIYLLTKNSISSGWVMTEIGAAKAYQQVRENVLLIPIVFGQIPLPDVLRDVQAMFAAENKVDKAIQDTIDAINRFLGVSAAKQQARNEIQERLETNAASFIEDAMLSLTQRERSHKRMAVLWYVLGYLSLFIGIVAIVMLTSESVSQFSTKQDQWPLLLFLAMKSIIIIGLLIASSKYSFGLGKSYMNEALKNSDRIHAISFGKFYLKAYGDKATWQEIKEVFQHWNISKDSSFALLDSKDYDPQFVNSAIELAKALASQTTKQK